MISEQIEAQVVSVILELASSDSLDEYRTEAVAVSTLMYVLILRKLSKLKWFVCWCNTISEFKAPVSSKFRTVVQSNTLLKGKIYSETRLNALSGSNIVGQAEIM